MHRRSLNAANNAPYTCSLSHIPHTHTGSSTKQGFVFPRSAIEEEMCSMQPPADAARVEELKGEGVGARVAMLCALHLLAEKVRYVCVLW